MQGGKRPQIYDSSAIPEADVQIGKSNNCFTYYVNLNIKSYTAFFLKIQHTYTRQKDLKCYLKLLWLSVVPQLSNGSMV